MAKDNSGLGSCVVAVGDPGSGLVQTTVRLAREWEIDAVPCDNVYSAVAAMAKAADRRVLVVGEMRELAKEDSAFFRVAAAHAVRCCCLLDKGSPAGREDLLAALRAGVAILGDVAGRPGHPQGMAHGGRVPRLAARRAGGTARKTPCARRRRCNV
jgi:hypothetical protein